MRLVKQRLHPQHLKRAWLRSTFLLILMIVAALTVGKVFNRLEVGLANGVYIVAILQLITAFILFASTVLNIRAAKVPAKIRPILGKDAPTLSVCIPARNETVDLEECLDSLIRSDYPKLEILVLDDSSQNKRTPEIIRDYAQNGVIFIQGETPPASWLAKNYAYEQLAKGANGEILLFCGVDCRFETKTISSLVSLMMQTHLQMISVLPKNELKPGLNFGRSLIQPSRYAWELALPRRLLNRPPVLSTCWLITRRAFNQTGGFEAVHHKIVPESYFSRQLFSKHPSYNFLLSNSDIGLVSTKSLVEQRSTAIRTRYPQTHRRPEMVALITLAQFGQLLWPYILAVLAVSTGRLTLLLLSVTTCLINQIVYGLLVNLAYRQPLWLGLAALPFAAVYDICLLNYSMLAYEFGEVYWKGRNVALPVMKNLNSTASLAQTPQK